MTGASNIPRRKGNPFKIGDEVACIHAGWFGLVKGQKYIVTNVDEKHVCVGSDGVGGAIFERFELVTSADDLHGINMDASEYEAALEAQEAYEKLVNG